MALPASKGKPSLGIAYTIKSFYYDPFKWQLVKSWSMFAVGIFVAREIATLDLNPSQLTNV